MHFLGMSGMPRRIVDYPDAFAGLNHIACLRRSRPQSRADKNNSIGFGEIVGSLFDKLKDLPLCHRSCT
jgi:hypothetical protein